MNLLKSPSRARTSHVSALTAIILCLTPLVLQSRTILVSSGGEEHYCASRSTSPALPYETYLFYPGHFEPGPSRSLMGPQDFHKICETLAQALQKQNYHLLENEDTQDPDLVIVVHWGETTVKRESSKWAFEDPNGEYTSLETFIPDPKYERINAKLLGTEKRISRSGTSIRKDLARYATNTERYFFILEAYDFAAFKRKERVLKWSTRFSTPCKWLSHETAIKQSAQVAARYFGKNMADITFESADHVETQVDLGEIEVIQNQP